MKHLSKISIMGNKETGGMKKEIDEGSLELSIKKKKAVS